MKGEDWIGYHPNGSLSGLTGQVFDGDADIALSEASMVMLRVPGINNSSKSAFAGIKYISYLHATSATKITALFRQPDANTVKDIVMSTFTLKMWIGWIVVWAVILMSIFIMVFVIKTTMFGSKGLLGSRFQFHELDCGESITTGLPATKMKYVDLVLWWVSQISCQGNCQTIQLRIKPRQLRLIWII